MRIHLLFKPFYEKFIEEKIAEISYRDFCFFYIQMLYGSCDRNSILIDIFTDNEFFETFKELYPYAGWGYRVVGLNKEDVKRLVMGETICKSSLKEYHRDNRQEVQGYISFSKYEYGVDNFLKLVNRRFFEIRIKQYNDAIDVDRLCFDFCKAFNEEPLECQRMKFTSEILMKIRDDEHFEIIK